MENGDREFLKDLFWGMYEEHTAHGRHLETQRSAVTSMILVLAGAFTALITVDKTVNEGDAPLTLFLVALGLFGAVFSAQHYAKYSMHKERAKQYRDALDLLIAPTSSADVVRQHVDDVFALARDPASKLNPWKQRRVEERLNKSESFGLLKALKRAGDVSYERSYISWLGYVAPGGLHSLWVVLHLFVAVLGGVLTAWAFWWPHKWQ